MGNGLCHASPIIGRSLKYFESPCDQIETFQDDIEYDASLLLIGSPSLVDYDKSDSIITPPHLKRINISMEMNDLIIKW